MGVEAKDTVKTGGELCLLVCQEYRSATLDGKNCDGLDCEVCQLTKQAEISFPAGKEKEYKKWVKAFMEAGILIATADTVDIAIKETKRAGRREVVEWSNDICLLHGDADARVRQGRVLRKGHCYECWQAQLKVWEIEVDHED